MEFINEKVTDLLLKLGATLLAVGSRGDFIPGFQRWNHQEEGKKREIQNTFKSMNHALTLSVATVTGSALVANITFGTAQEVLLTEVQVP